MNARMKNLVGTLLIAAGIVLTSLVLPAACVPDSQAEAEAVAADVQDAKTAAMQAAIDARCQSRAAHEQLACAVDALAELQPERWMPEDADRAALAVPFATNE